MSFLTELSEEIDAIFKTKWKTRDGDKVPEAEDVQLGNDAVLLDGTVLYADLADSTQLVYITADVFNHERFIQARRESGATNVGKIQVGRTRNLTLSLFLEVETRLKLEAHRVPWSIIRSNASFVAVNNAPHHPPARPEKPRHRLRDRATARRNPRPA